MSYLWITSQKYVTITDMKKGTGFFPTEIIFAVTDRCNKHCRHCYVQQKNIDLDIEKCKTFIESCPENIERIGFSGGEPFLNIDFIEEIVKTTVSKDMMFDQIITNGDWWKSEDQLESVLKRIYDAGFDGKIGLSYDSFHGQELNRIITFIKTVHRIWNQGDILNIQSVISENPEKIIEDLENFDKLALALNCNVELELNKKTGKGVILLENDEIYLPVYREIQSFKGNDERAWKSRKWFKDDFCEGPGQVLFVHSDGNIAPCCGFANENKELFIGTVSENYQQIMENARHNKMVKICYENGLSKKIKKLKKKMPGKTDDICAFCDFVCKISD